MTTNSDQFIRGFIIMVASQVLLLAPASAVTARQAPDVCDARISTTPIAACATPPCWYRQQVDAVFQPYITELPLNVTLPRDACLGSGGAQLDGGQRVAPAFIPKALPMTDIASSLQFGFEGFSFQNELLSLAEQSVQLPGNVNIRYKKWEVVPAPNCLNPFDNSIIVPGVSIISYSADNVAAPDTCAAHQITSTCIANNGFDNPTGVFASCGETKTCFRSPGSVGFAANLASCASPSSTASVSPGGGNLYDSQASCLSALVASQPLAGASTPGICATAAVCASESVPSLTNCSGGSLTVSAPAFCDPSQKYATRALCEAAQGRSCTSTSGVLEWKWNFMAGMSEFGCKVVPRFAACALNDLDCLNGNCRELDNTACTTENQTQNLPKCGCDLGVGSGEFMQSVYQCRRVTTWSCVP